MGKDERAENHRRRTIAQARQIIYFILGLIEVILGFRFVFKLLGANPLNSVVSFIYSISDVLVAPFFDIFRTVVTEGIEVVSVFEPATLVAMLVYVIIAWAIVRVIEIFVNGNRQIK